MLWGSAVPTAVLLPVVRGVPVPCLAPVPSHGFHRDGSARRCYGRPSPHCSRGESLIMSPLTVALCDFFSHLECNPDSGRMLAPCPALLPPAPSLTLSHLAHPPAATLLVRALGLAAPCAWNTLPPKFLRAHFLPSVVLGTNDISTRSLLTC